MAKIRIETEPHPSFFGKGIASFFGKGTGTFLRKNDHVSGFARFSPIPKQSSMASTRNRRVVHDKAN
jgi:hypothetical protein